MTYFLVTMFLMYQTYLVGAKTKSQKQEMLMEELAKQKNCEEIIDAR